ncbi:MAG: dUTP diphosphatase [Clostridia bacterium]|nr:dUTP diphosphatase [Clostridia bacterium]
MTNVMIQKMRACAKIPAYATDGSAAVDLCAAIEEEITLAPGERRLIPTGIAISIPKGTVAILSARSGLSYKKGIAAANGIGVIDSDYRGEIFFSSVNLSNEPYTVTPGERICQMMLMPVFAMNFTEVASLDETLRGAGGFGSTGNI